MTKTNDLAKSLVQCERFTSEEQAKVFLEEFKNDVCSSVSENLLEKIDIFEGFISELKKLSTEEFYKLVNVESGFITYNHGCDLDYMLADHCIESEYIDTVNLDIFDLTIHMNDSDLEDEFIEAIDAAKEA